KIRVVDDYRNGTPQALMQELINAGIRVQIRPSDSYIMHNKFFVFDGRDTSAHGRKWLWGGSANITNAQFSSDVQNVILVQDESLCNTYTREFEEMWGSHNDVNNPSLAKFGPAKQDNTPHVFNINGKRWEIYFAPSDNCSNKFITLLNNEPNKSINFCIYSFTMFTIANKMKAKYNPPTLMVRGVFDQSNSSSSLYQEMKGIGGTSPWNPPAKVWLDNYSGLLHDKYTIIDADLMTSNPVVETGSFNYTNAADQGNDENMMIIYDSLIANQYYQDFVKRITDAGGTVGIQRTSFEVPGNFSLSQNYPNPFNPATQLKLSVSKSSDIKVLIYDVLGRQVASLVDNRMEPGEYLLNWNASSYPSGVYFYQLSADGIKMDVKKMVLKK
ncbi:MAG: phospholipase D-like domain-containing protein, partial [Bacteroidetes bacterium]|nr:phospholipase D-like domain-containing protein [Bacteroidota bacterium]